LIQLLKRYSPPSSTGSYPINIHLSICGIHRHHHRARQALYRYYTLSSISIGKHTWALAATRARSRMAAKKIPAPAAKVNSNPDSRWGLCPDRAQKPFIYFTWVATTARYANKHRPTRRRSAIFENGKSVFSKSDFSRPTHSTTIALGILDMGGVNASQTLSQVFYGRKLSPCDATSECHMLIFQIIFPGCTKMMMP